MAVGIGLGSRECGTKKDGWYIDGGTPSDKGTLLPLVWAVGSMVLELDPNAKWAAPERGNLVFIDGEQSFDPVQTEWMEHRVGMANRASGSYRGSKQLQLERLGHSTNNPLCLLKHMGRSYYTPATKALELARLGPSERMEQDMVLTLAPILREGPLKLFYTSSQVPFFVKASERDEFMDYLFLEQPDQAHLLLQVAWSMRYDEGETTFHPTWEMADWSWRMRRTTEGLVFPNNGSMHWWVKLLSYVHRHQDIDMGQFGIVERNALVFGTHLTTARRVVTYETAQEMTGRDTIVPSELDDEALFPKGMTDEARRKALKNGVQVSVLPPQGNEEWT